MKQDGGFRRLVTNWLVVGFLALAGTACTSRQGETTTSAAQPAKVNQSVARDLATLDAWCWRIELNKNTDYSVQASATAGGISDASVYAQGSSWAEALGKAVADLKAKMAAKGIAPEAAMARQRSRTFSEAEIGKVRDRYARIDGKAWYIKGTKSDVWSIICRADVGQITGVTVLSEGPTLIVALDTALAKLEEELAKRTPIR